MDYNKLRASIFQLLEESLPEQLSYHGLHHTKDVLQTLEIYIQKEGVTEEYDRILLRTGAILHDVGFTIDYQNHEENGVKIAKKLLPDFGYSNAEIDIVSNLILATKVPQIPHTLLEEILCDCDLDYLGRNDFDSISNSLYSEWKAYNLVDKESEFDYKQIRFLENHTYFTKFAQLNRAPLKAEILQKIKNKFKH